MGFSWEWTTNFTTPSVLTGLVLTQDGPVLVATWTASAATYHYAYLVEAQTLDGDWVEVGRPTTPVFRYTLAAPNLETNIRVSDWNGAADPGGYSLPVEASATLVLYRWWMVDLRGGDEFTEELRFVVRGEATEKGLDQVILDPLSGDDGEVAFPIVITGQRRAERITLSMDVVQEDAYIIRLLERASRLPSGSVAFKDWQGPVYVVQVGPLRTSGIVVGKRVEVSAVRVA
jgi:hypothetical protein